MTNEEFEKRCREEMQQTIPDREALWAQIESRLPAQMPEKASPQKNARPDQILFRVMGAAACLMLVIAGVRLVNRQLPQSGEVSEADSTANTDNTEILQNDGDLPAHDASGDKAEENAPLRYSDLNVPHGNGIQITVPLSMPEGEYFNEEDVLAASACFADVRVTDGWQDTTSGSVHYTLSVVAVYGEAALPETLTLVSDTPYLLELSHEYVLPLRQADGSRAWELTSDCAPQIERTADDKVVFHSGWYSLMEDSTPVLCDQRSKDDYFYDRMYLTGYTAMEQFLQKWEAGTL